MLVPVFNVHSMRLIVFSVLTLLSLSVQSSWYSHSGEAMGTSINITVWHPRESVSRLAVKAVMGEMERVDQLLSPYLESSELSRVNALAYLEPQKVSDDFFNIVQQAKKISYMSQGAFDITFASVGFYYDYRQKQQPTPGELTQLISAINYNHIVLNTKNRSIAFLDARVKIDLGGIAKGYAVDNSIRKLQALGITSASVSAGGDSYLLGDRGGRPWITGVKHPRLQSNQDPSQVVLKLPLSDTAVSTSGDYERFFIDDKTGERVHHIVNPKTGRSASDVMSVTILAPTGAFADPLSTTVFVMGVEKGLKLVNSLPEIDAVIINNQGRVVYSDGLKPQ